MDMDRIRTAIVVALCLISGLAAQTTARKTAAKPASTSTAHPAARPSPPPMLLPSSQQVDAALRRSFGYDPGLSWNILDIRASEIPGLADVVVSMNKQNPVHIYYFVDTEKAIVGELMPFGPNPYGQVREKLKAADGPAKGAATPAIEIVDFSDLECPHCKAAQPILEKLVGDFPQVQLRFQQFPLPPTFHPWAMKAAQYADCAAHIDKDAFWKYVDTIFENQGSIALATADDKLKEYATTAGLDANKVATCAAERDTEARVQKSLDLGKELDVTATPTVFINGRRVLGAANIPYEQLKALVQFEIDHAGK
jgi:protein-disulfide isomerase